MYSRNNMSAGRRTLFPPTADPINRNAQLSQVEFTYMQENGTPPWVYNSESSTSSNQNSVVCTPHHVDSQIDGISTTKNTHDDRPPLMTPGTGSVLGLDVPMRELYNNDPHQHDHWHDSFIAPSPPGGSLETLSLINYASSTSPPGPMFSYIYNTPAFSVSAPHLPSYTQEEMDMSSNSHDAGRTGFSLSPQYRPQVNRNWTSATVLHPPGPSERGSLSPIGSYLGPDEEDIHQQYYDSASSSLQVETPRSYRHNASEPFSNRYPLFQEKVGSDRIREVSSRRRTNPNKKLYACEFPGCAATLTSKHNYKSHRNSHYGIKNYECKYEQCTKRFGTYTEAKRHSEKHCKYAPHRSSITSRSN